MRVELPDGFEVFRWVVPQELLPAPLFLDEEGHAELEWSSGVVPFLAGAMLPWPDDGSQAIQLELRNRRFLVVNGRLSGVVLEGASESEAAQAVDGVSRHARVGGAGRPPSVVLIRRSSRLSSSLLRALERFPAGSLFLFLVEYAGYDSGLRGLGTLGHRVAGLTVSGGVSGNLGGVLERLAGLRYLGLMGYWGQELLLRSITHMHLAKRLTHFRSFYPSSSDLGSQGRLAGVVGSVRETAVEHSTPTLLQRLPELRDLRVGLCKPPITTAGIKHDKLQTLRLCSLSITDLTGLESLPRLRTLMIDGGTYLGIYLRDGYRLLGLLKALRALILGGGAGPKILDPARLAGLNRLEALLWSSDFFPIPIMDRGLEHVARLGKLRALRLESVEAKGPGVVSLSRLSALRSLTIRRASLTPEAFRALGRLSGLEALSLARLRVTDEQLTSLRSMGKLRSLSLSGLRRGDLDLGDPGLGYLAGLPELRALQIATEDRLPRLTDNALSTLARRGQLRALRLPEARFTDVGLSHLTRLTALRSLELGGRGITDTGLAHLARLGELRLLILRNTRITLRGLRSHASAWPHLSRLVLIGTASTPNERARLRAALPGCEVLVR